MIAIYLDLAYVQLWPYIFQDKVKLKVIREPEIRSLEVEALFARKPSSDTDIMQ